MDEIFDWYETLIGAADDLDKATKLSSSQHMTIADHLAFAQVQALVVIAHHLGTVSEKYDVAPAEATIVPQLRHEPALGCEDHRLSSMEIGVLRNWIALASSGDSEADYPPFLRPTAG